MSKRNVLISLCCATYFMSGMILGMRTNIFLFIQRVYLDGYQHIANLVLFSGIAMQFSLFAAGHLIERFGFQKVLPLGLLFSALPLSAMIFVDSILGFDICYFIFMAGYGIVVLNLNLFVSYLMPERKGNALLILHLFFALGALTGPKWISATTDASWTWQSVLSLTTIPFYIILILLLVFSGKEFLAAGRRSPSDAEAGAGKALSAYLKDPFLWLFIGAFITSQVWEYGLGTWFVLFANKAKGLGSSEAAFYLTLFYASYPLVRILFARVIHRLDLIVVLSGAFICCILFSSLGMFTGRMYFYSLTGMGIALMYPGLMAAMQHIFGENSLKKIGFVTMTGGLLQYVIIWSIGLMSDRFGISFGFNFMIAYLVLGLFSILGILSLQAKRRKAESLVETRA